MFCVQPYFSSVKMEVHVAIINLVYRKSRRNRIMKLVGQLREAAKYTNYPIVSVNFVEAVDGVRQSFDQLETRYGLKPFPDWAIDDPENRFPSSWRIPQTSGGIASGLSHLDVAALARNWYSSDSTKYVLVMEDDCVITSSPEGVYGHFINCVEEAEKNSPDWDMIMLGAAGHRPDIAPPRPFSSNNGLVEHAGFSYLTTMYWLSKAGSRKLVESRPLCVPNCLAFDELHNVLAGLTGQVRPELRKISETGGLNLLSSVQSLVRQDPYDCVHDTAATSRKGNKVETDEDDVAPPEVTTPPIRSYDLEPMKSFTVGIGVNWYRRKPHRLTEEDIVKEFGGQLKKTRKSKPPPVVVQRPVESFSLMATLMRKKRESAIYIKEDFPMTFDSFKIRE